jgi:hypothetical protein
VSRLLPGLSAIGVAVAAAGITVGSTTLIGVGRAPGTSAEPLPITPAAQTLVCSGPETLLVPTGGQAVDPGGAVVISGLIGSSWGPASARVELLGHVSSPALPAPVLPSGSIPIRRGRHLQLSTDSPGTAVKALAAAALGPAVIKALGPGAGSPARSADGAPSLAAVQSTLARGGDLRALTAAGCAVPRPEAWLVGGGTVDGERLRLLIANPSAAAAVVDVDVHGPAGRVPAPSGEGVVVPAGGEVPIFVDALAPGLAQVAVHVTARSGRVVATLYDSLLRGVVPGGADDVPVGAGPARRLVIPGVSLVNGYGKTADDPAAAGSTSVRVAVPGAAEAVVRIRLFDSSGEVTLPRAAVVSVPAGGVNDIAISGIPSGTYTAVVDADVPVVAGARVGRGSPAGAGLLRPAAEFAWAAAADRLAGDGFAVLPPGTRSTLSLVADRGTGRLVLTGVQVDGSLDPPVSVEVPARTSATVQLADGTAAVKISGLGGGPVAASIVATADDARGQMISVLPVNLAAASTPATTSIEDHRLGLR